MNLGWMDRAGLIAKTALFLQVRACSLLASIVQGFGLDLPETTVDNLQEAMLGRLKDKVSASTPTLHPPPESHTTSAHLNDALR